MGPRLRWGQIKPSQPPRRVASGARTSRHSGARTTCQSHTNDWEAELKQRLSKREDRTDHEWFDLDSGCTIVLGCDGGWRDPTNSMYRLFHSTAHGQVTEISSALGTTKRSFDATREASDTYGEVEQTLVARVSELLHATDPWASA